MIDYREVLVDLEAREQKLQSVIRSMRELMEVSERAADEPASSAAVKPKRRVLKPKPAPAGQPAAAESKPMGQREVIRQIVSEKALTAPEITDRVIEIRPQDSRNAISTQICQLIKEGKLYKDDFLKVRLVNGATSNGLRNAHGAAAQA